MTYLSYAYTVLTPIFTHPRHRPIVTREMDGNRPVRSFKKNPTKIDFDGSRTVNSFACRGTQGANERRVRPTRLREVVWGTKRRVVTGQIVHARVSFFRVIDRGRGWRGVVRSRETPTTTTTTRRETHARVTMKPIVGHVVLRVEAKVRTRASLFFFVSFRVSRIECVRNLPSSSMEETRSFG